VNWDSANGLATDLTRKSLRSMPVPNRTRSLPQACQSDRRAKKFPRGNSFLQVSCAELLGQKTSNPMPIATRSNIVFLQKPGALSRLALPNTISDAMYACAKLRHRYIWVGSLCIVQNNEDYVKEKIVRISDIYSGAFLTIIAACGGHSDLGLPESYGVLQEILSSSQTLIELSCLRFCLYLIMCCRSRDGGLEPGRRVVPEIEPHSSRIITQLYTVNRNGFCLIDVFTSLMFRYTSSAKLRCTTNTRG
jgi:hypothetical protein